MKKSITTLLAFFLLAGSVSAAEPLILKGTLVDNMCAEGHKDNIDNFVKGHTKECALMPACAASGYSIYSGGKLYKFDAESSEVIKEFLDDPSTGLGVEVKAELMENGELALTMIKNL